MQIDSFRIWTQIINSVSYNSLVWFYGISTIVGYLMPNPAFTYILDIYDLKTHSLIHTVQGSSSSISNNSI